MSSWGLHPVLKMRYNMPEKSTGGVAHENTISG
jgi:hypothetical protein